MKYQFFKLHHTIYDHRFYIQLLQKNDTSLSFKLKLYMETKTKNK